MSEYWKSTPNYWCKHCKAYVRDTKLGRSNHEAMLKHQNAVKRELTSLHRNHEREEREQDRAKREIERLNSIASSSTDGSRPTPRSSSAAPAPTPTPTSKQAVQADRQRQLEQLAELGVNIPGQLRGDLAMAGEWTVTNTRVIEDEEAKTRDGNNTDAVATGVRKRALEKTQEQLEEEEAVSSLFKKPRRWGKDSRTMPADNDGELDALLSGPLAKPAKKEEQPESDAAVKEEEDVADTTDEPLVKQEEPEPPTIDPPPDEAEKEETPEVPAVLFKKRKAKSARQI